MTDDDVREELLTLERRGWEALCDGTGAEFYGGLMTPDGVMVLADGTVMGREEVVAALRESPPWAAYEIAGVRTVSTAGDAAVLVYTGRAWRTGAPTWWRRPRPTAEPSSRPCGSTAA